MNYEIRYVRGHVEVYDQMGRFRFSADSEWEALEELELPDYLPEEIRSRYRLIGFREAMEKIHFPGSQEDLSLIHI